jgi:hypothetical protein
MLGYLIMQKENVSTFRSRKALLTLVSSVALRKCQISTLRRTASSGMLRRVALVRTDVSEKLSASIIRVTRISTLGTTLDVTANRRTQRSNTKWWTIWRHYVPPKRRFLQQPRGVTSQKTLFFIVTAAKTSILHSTSEFPTASHVSWEVFSISSCLTVSITDFSSWLSRGSVGGWGTMLQAGRSPVRDPVVWIFFSNMNWRFHGCNFEECCPLGCYTMWLL